MKSLLLAMLPLSLLLFASSSCQLNIPKAVEPSGPIIEQTRQMQNITNLSVSSGITAEYIQADSLQISIKAPSDIIDLVETKFQDSTLTIGFSKAVNLKNTSVTIKISAPGITNFTAASGSDIAILSGINSAQKEITLTSSSGATITSPRTIAGSIHLLASSGSEISVDSASSTTINATTSSGAEINIAGICNTANLISSSGSEISADRLNAKSGSMAASSGGEIKCHIDSPASICKSSGGSVKNR